MIDNDTYTNIDAARRLHVLGDWDHAAALLSEEESTEALELKAEILYERFLFRAEGIESAADAIAALDSGGRVPVRCRQPGDARMGRVSLGRAPRQCPRR